MPSTVRNLLSRVGLTPDGVVRWHQPIPGQPPGRPDSGLYLVALTDDPDNLTAALPVHPISRVRLDELLATRPELSVDGVRPSPERLAERLGGSWLPDEVVLYIGLADTRKKPVKPSALSRRVTEFYKTPLGARAPHAGGWFIKTLENLDGLFVHYAYAGDVGIKEDNLLRAFRAGVSAAARCELWDQTNVMPFANVLYPGRQFKQHGIDSAKAKLRQAGISASRPASVTAARPASPSVQTTPDSFSARRDEAGTLWLD